MRSTANEDQEFTECQTFTFRAKKPKADDLNVQWVMFHWISIWLSNTSRKQSLYSPYINHILNLLKPSGYLMHQQV
jgi:hypothetical protein